MADMTPTQTLAKLLEESYRWMKTHAPGCHGLHDGAVEISDLIADLRADRERLEALESMLSIDFVLRWHKGSNSLRQEIDAARRAGV